ncbi:LysR family transcriptional regulator [Klebsiella pneumoniae]|uniref:LysR family transcriptional regulator n=1 Tax=Klebsiella pneumoniae TaxID=573 RepID=UPI0034590402
MDRVIAAQVYLRICELGSLSAAARALGMSRPMVSRYLEQMESWAGARLIHRSTRRLTLTPAGEKVLLKTRGLTRIADEIAGERQRADPSGTLEVVLPEWTPKALSVYGIYLSRDYQPDGLPLFLDALQRRLGEETGHG